MVLKNLEPIHVLNFYYHLVGIYLLILFMHMKFVLEMTMPVDKVCIMLYI